MLEKILDQIISWPVAAVIGLIILYRPLSRLIDRIKTIDKLGIKTDIAPQQIAELPDDKLGVAGEADISPSSKADGRSQINRGSHVDTADSQSRAELILKSFDYVRGPMFDQLLHQIRTDLETHNISGELRERVLLESLTGNVVGKRYEQIYISIFGSQLGLLLNLNDLGQAGLSIDQVRRSYEDTVSGAPQAYADVTFDQWFEYLKGYRLISVTSDSVTISPRGKGLLKYLIHHGRSLAKQF